MSVAQGVNYVSLAGKPFLLSRNRFFSVEDLCVLSEFLSLQAF